MYTETLTVSASDALQTPITNEPVIISHPAGELGAFDAEITALAAVISSAIENRQQRLRVYTDNYGLAQLWREKRNDRRLEKIRELGKKLERLSVFPVPRLHNQPANALAKQAIRTAFSQDVKASAQQ